MKISEQEKQETRRRILDAALEVITTRGYREASMREIARVAQVGDATIYNYFPSKEKLLYGYCLGVQEQVQARLLGIPDFHTYPLHEQLHELVQSTLEIWLPAREFLQAVFDHAFHAPVSAHTHLEAARAQNFAMVADLIASAEEVGEIPPQPGGDFLPRLFWDFQTAILGYWLKDDSEEFAHTTRLLDGSMEIIAGVLHQGLLGKAMELAAFLFRTHVLARIDTWGSFIRSVRPPRGPQADAPGDEPGTAGPGPAPKRGFLERRHGRP